MSIFNIIKRSFYDVYEFEKALTKVAKLGLFVGECKPKLHLVPIEFYQDNYRFYLDECDGQEKLREEWFINRKIRKSMYELDEIINNFLFFETDQIFNNRWIKRS